MLKDSPWEEIASTFDKARARQPDLSEMLDFYEKMVKQQHRKVLKAAMPPLWKTLRNNADAFVRYKMRKLRFAGVFFVFGKQFKWSAFFSSGSKAIGSAVLSGMPFANRLCPAFALDAVLHSRDA